MSEGDGVQGKEFPKNQTRIENGVMTLVLYLDVEGDDSTFIKAIGSLELSKDLVKSYFANKAAAEAIVRQRQGLIKPLVH
jgi:hypothetical protein